MAARPRSAATCRVISSAAASSASLGALTVGRGGRGLRLGRLRLLPGERRRGAQDEREQETEASGARIDGAVAHARPIRGTVRLGFPRAVTLIPPDGTSRAYRRHRPGRLADAGRAARRWCASSARGRLSGVGWCARLAARSSGRRAPARGGHARRDPRRRSWRATCASSSTRNLGRDDPLRLAAGAAPAAPRDRAVGRHLARSPRHPAAHGGAVPPVAGPGGRRAGGLGGRASRAG